MIKEATEQLSKGKDLTASQMEAVMEEIMTGSAKTPQVISFLLNLNERGETPEEFAAAVRVMRRHAVTIQTKHRLILDTCGTGGDRKHTFNISTTAAFVASGAGIVVAKHGNRSVSSSSGSADVLERLGININMTKEKTEKCLDDLGIAFLFAPNFHPAMKYAMEARKKMGVRTIFNFLGPLSNPAGATHQLVGVYDSGWADILANGFKELGTEHALIVRGDDGLDEITTTTKSSILEVHSGKLRPQYQISPEDFGFKRAKPGDLGAGTPADNAKILLDVLSGKSGPKRDIVILNAAAAIYAADKARSIKDGIGIASESIDSGDALKKLELFKDYSLQNA